jgi:Tol biopolymer transport system component
MDRFLLPGQTAELYVLEVKTGDRRLVYRSTDLLFEAPNWSSDGQSLVINGDGHLYRLPVSGGTGPEQIDLGDVPPINNDHVLSPDAATVYVSAEDGHIYAVPMTGGQARRVTNDRGPDFAHYLHGISPDGTTLAYIGLQGRGDDPPITNVYLISVDGLTERQLTDDTFPDDGSEFGPDGQWIYFNSERAASTPGHAQLFRITADGSTSEQLTTDERVNWFPHPSPDGSRIVYVSFPPGTLGHPPNLDVIIRLLDHDGVRDLVHLFGGQGTMNVPSWDPTGNSIAYVAYPLLDNKGSNA